MKPQYSGDESMKQKLLDVVVMRDNIGEAMWYLYTGILLISITQYNLTTQGCKQTVESINEVKQKFNEEQEEMAKKETTQTYEL
jgi:hypothetical protein